jgi:hypothetical protein
MNKSDIKLVSIIFIISLVFIVYFYLNKADNKVAKVYYRNDLVKEIDMSINEVKEYTIIGTNGDVVILYENGKIRVKEENSKRNLCSIQGFIKESYETIICLPNEVIIKIEAKENLDTVIR